MYRLTSPVALSFIIIVLLLGVHSKVCVEERFVTETAIEAYTYSYIQYYIDKNYYTHQQVATGLKDRTVTKSKTISSEVCCSGYTKDDEFAEVSDITCKPICASNCTNGYCKRPGKCACNAGYTKSNGNCVPTCKPDCLHGTCVAPNVCQCDHGYEMVDDTCQPICTKPCRNGFCKDPDTCECLPGYIINWINGECEPHCSNNCRDGVCAAPEICDCHPGWGEVRIRNKTQGCFPVCTYPCGNGTCLLPDYCDCDVGYSVNFSKPWSIDKPICEPECKDCSGVCVAPDVCENVETTTTNTNYIYDMELSSTDSVVVNPVCTFPCGNGTCLFPGYCQCDAGYGINYSKPWSIDKPICEPECWGCSGVCVAPDVCVDVEITTTTSNHTIVIFDTEPSSTVNVNKNAYDNETGYDNKTSYLNNNLTITNHNATEGETEKTTWIQENGLLILVPTIVIITVAIIIAVVWRQKLARVLGLNRMSYSVRGTKGRNVVVSFEKHQTLPN